MQNQGFYLKFGEFSGKTTSLDTKLQVKKKKVEVAQNGDRNINYEHTCAWKIFNNIGYTNAPTREETK